MKNLGVILVIVGALLLIICALPVQALSDLADQNWYTVGSFVIIIIGLIAHIVLNKIYID